MQSITHWKQTISNSFYIYCIQTPVSNNDAQTLYKNLNINLLSNDFLNCITRFSLKEPLVA